MRHLVSLLFNRLIRLAGGRPEVVRPLFAGLLLSDAGDSEILRLKNPRKTYLSGSTLRILILVVSVLGSIALAVVMALSSDRGHPPLGVLILVVSHFMVVSGMVLAQAGPGLLARNDAQVIGWWPLTKREQMLARISVILKPALEVTVALTAAPLLVFVFTGTPPVLAALLFGVGLLVQTVGVTFGVTATVLFLVRRFGRSKAERLVGAVSSGPLLMIALFYLPTMIIEKVFPWVEIHPWGVVLLPPVWFAAWGDPTAGIRLILLAGLGLVVSLLVVWVGMRLAVASDSVIRVPSQSHGQGKADIGSVLAFLLRPFMRGTEGWALRVLLKAHVREDWRFVGSLIGVPILMAFYGFGLGDPAELIDPESVRHSAIMATNMLMMMLFAGFIVLNSAQYSSTPQALWVVALANLDSNRILDAQRGMVRGLIFLPSGVVYVLRAHQVGASWPVILVDLLVLGFQMDLILLILQSRVKRMPFSSGYAPDHSSRRVITGMVTMGISLVFVLADFAYVQVSWARYILWCALPLLWLFFRWRLNRGIMGRRLKMDILQ